MNFLQGGAAGPRPHTTPPPTSIPPVLQVGERSPEPQGHAAPVAEARWDSKCTAELPSSGEGAGPRRHGSELHPDSATPAWPLGAFASLPDDEGGRWAPGRGAGGPGRFIKPCARVWRGGTPQHLHAPCLPVSRPGLLHGLPSALVLYLRAPFYLFSC